MKKILISFILIIVSTAIQAQSISVEDLKAQIDARVGGLNEYQELLNDPDPNRSMAAMELMMASGDETLVNMAKNYGIFSPNPAVREAALNGYFASGPVLEMLFDGSNLDDSTDMTRVLGPINGSVSGTGIGYVSVKLGSYDAKNQCYTANVLSRTFLENGCFLRNSENGVAIFLWETWWRLTLNDEGALKGSGRASYNGRSINGLPISIQIAQ